jgi:hypothetical protein
VQNTYGLDEMRSEATFQGEPIPTQAYRLEFHMNVDTYTQIIHVNGWYNAMSAAQRTIDSKAGYDYAPSYIQLEEA